MQTCRLPVGYEILDFAAYKLKSEVVQLGDYLSKVFFQILGVVSVCQHL